LALAAAAFTPRPACACSTVENAWRATMKADLRTIAERQRAYVNRTGRFASQAETLGPDGVRLSSTIVVRGWEESGPHLSVRVAAPRGTTAECSVTIVRDSGLLPMPDCTAYPFDRWHFGLAIAYFALLAVAVHGRYTRVGRGLPPVGARTIVQGLFLLVAHPFWDPIRSTEGCRTDRLLYAPALLVVAGTALYVWRRSTPAAPPSASA
jgi:hypothetical protein